VIPDAAAIRGRGLAFWFYPPDQAKYPDIAASAGRRAETSPSLPIGKNIGSVIQDPATVFFPHWPLAVHSPSRQRVGLDSEIARGSVATEWQIFSKGL
jgi:hypothetical protein